MALLQGVTELFPISSLGHAVILPRLLHWPIDQKAPDFLPYLVVMHLGTAIALFLYFWRDWLSFLRSIVERDAPRSAADRRIFFHVVIATIPAVVVGFGLRKLLGEVFGTPQIAAFFLIANGAMLYFGDQIAGEGVGVLDQLNWKGALAVGFAQVFALIPGFSRSGLTIVAGTVAGLKHEDSARFSFLMATPIILRRHRAGSAQVAEIGRDPRRRLAAFGRRGRRDRLCQPRHPDALFQHARVQGAAAVLLLLRDSGSRQPRDHGVLLIAPLGGLTRRPI